MSISFNHLGQYGRLGNQIFQFCSLKGIARKNNYNFTIPKNSHQLFNCFTMQTLTESNKCISSAPNVLHERFFGFDEVIFEKCPDNIDIIGYFQTEKYFKHIKDELKKDLTFHQSIIDESNKILTTINSKDIISLHIRRGDYINNPMAYVRHGDCCTLKYYEKALSLFDSSLPVILFTDDPDWIRNQKFFNKERFFMFYKDNDTVKYQYLDLCLMSMCQFHIIANSSYSWWGSWLSNSLRTVAPKKWFNKEGHKCWHDIYCEDWILL